MPSRRPHAVSLCLLALLVAAIAITSATPGAAQIRPRIPKVNPLAKDKAATAPTYNDRVLEITDARVDQVLKGYATESASLAASDKASAEARRRYEEENTAHGARLKEYNEKDQAWQACHTREVDPVAAKEQAKMQKTQKDITGGDQAAFDKKMADVKERIQAAKAKGDMAEVMRLADSLQTAIGAPSAQAANKSAAAMQQAAGKCGPEPVKPEPPVPPQQPQANLDAEGAKAAGFTADQYALLKERIASAVTSDGKVQASSSQAGYSSAELDVLKRRGAELAKAKQSLEQHGQ